MIEEFKVVPEYDDYKISNFGRVKSLKAGRELILKQQMGSTGYKQITLYKANAAKSRTIHQLMAITFLGHSASGYKLVVDHIDNNKLNNNLSNLQVVTHRHNTVKDRVGKYPTGVSKCYNKYRARVTIDGTRHCLGLYKNINEAVEAIDLKLKDEDYD
jgi:hypothetical protein